MEYNIGKNTSGLYKYVVDDNVYYFGKSERDILERLRCHESEDKFKSILSCCSIYYAPMKNKVEICALEKLLINKYKPELNVVDAQEDGSEYNFEEPEWILCYDANIISIPEYIQKKKASINKVIESIDEIRDELMDLKELFEALQVVYHDSGTLSFNMQDLECTNFFVRFTCPCRYYDGEILIDKVLFDYGTDFNYKYHVEMHLSSFIVEKIKNDSIDKLIAKIDESIKVYNSALYIQENVNSMFDKISDSISRNGTWGDLEDAGWTFLRMFDLQKIAYIPECEDMTDQDREFYKNAKVDEDGRICKMGE